jgi:hypothetical protein
MRTGALECLFGSGVSNASYTAVTAAGGTSFVVRNSPQPAYLINTAVMSQTATVTNPTAWRVRSARMHDFIYGYQVGMLSGVSFGGAVQSAFAQPLVPQDTLTVEATGNSANNGIMLTMYYKQLPGADGILINESELAHFGVNLMGVECKPTPAAADFGTAVAINTTQDAFKANTYYAILGATTVLNSASFLRIRSANFGNLGVGIPMYGIGNAQQQETANYFPNISRRFGLNCIPVWNSANKGGTVIDAIGSTTAQDYYVQMVELAPSFDPSLLTN